MKKSTRKVLIAMIALLIVLVVLIVVLALTNKQVVPEQNLGDTVLSERATELQTPTEPEEETTTEPTSVDLPNEKELRFYVIDFGTNTAELITEYTSAWTTDADIATFEAINSDEQTIYFDSYFALHETYWDAVETDTRYQIGYELSFDVNGTHKVITIRKPSDITGSADLYMGDYPYDEEGNLITDNITGYMGVWVYNDIGQTGTYVHLTQEDMTDGVLMTSIKLRPTPQSGEISNLKLKTFSYSSETEFNSQGHYIGTHGYEIPVNNQ